MYKCSECGNEYKVMPKFCECGNDIFISTDREQDYTPVEIDDIEDLKPKSRTRNLKRKTFSPVAFAIFIFCIIFALLIIFVIGNPKKNTNSATAQTEQKEKIEIPSIETFWDNTPAKITSVPKPKEPENIIDKLVEQISPQPTDEIKTDTLPPKPPVQTPKKLEPVISKTNWGFAEPKSQQSQKQTTQKVPTQQTQPATQGKKPAQTKVQTQPKAQISTTQQPATFGDLTEKIRNQYYNNQNSNTQPNSTANAQSPTTATSVPSQSVTKQVTSTQQIHTQSSQKSANQIPAPTTQTNTQNIVPTVPVKSEAELKKELAKYKSGLRNTIGKKIDFTRVIGDGECSLTFKLDSNGRLTSKAFSKQSSNITLNDCAFYALNTTVSYNPPPEGYKGETLKLTIKFYNGNFEITLN